MKSDENRLIALVNLLADAFYPNPEDPGPIGPWGPWVREALDASPLPDPWSRQLQAHDSHWWQEHHPGPPPHWKAAWATLAALAGQVDDHDNPFGGRRPRPNWLLAALLHNPALLNPQPLPPVDGGIMFARALAHVALRRADEAGSEQAGNMLLRFADDWCGTMRLPIPLKPGVPGEPRPPRPLESLVLGATLVRAAGSTAPTALKQAAEQAGHRIFGHGLSGLA